MSSAGTRRLARAGDDREDGFAAFCREWEAVLVVLAGSRRGEGGHELALDRPRLVLGRGPDADLVFDDDDAMSQSHASLEFAGGGFRVRDLESTNGTRVNGASVQAADLEHGDRLEVGQHVLQYVLAERRREPRVHVLPEE